MNLRHRHNLKCDDHSRPQAAGSDRPLPGVQRYRVINSAIANPLSPAIE
jgi:hypothetical protein